jgi:hypothetical protein
MEPITIISLLMTCVLVLERLWKYTVDHLKRSSCCGGTVEFKSEKDLLHSSV